MWISDPTQVKRLITIYFKERFRCPNIDQCIGRGALQLNCISAIDDTNLEAKFSKEEIVLQEIDTNKAPGPDGFNANYIKHMWSHLQQDFYSFIHNFHQSATIPKGINSCFIALIPKVITPVLISDFRPISLINQVMKIILKIMANRLQGLLPNLIAEEHSAFIKGRQIADLILITNEVVHSIQNKQSKGLILKLDFEKAFDTVNWDFLQSTVQSMGFETKWRS